ncbi:MAG TPA: SDR family oxidoreductase [Bacteroides sp.]|nr:SDR family oxidoreductase [Bacteroides sp.]
MKDKTVLVTGGTSGIGRAAANELARLGARVVITYRDKAKGEATLKEIRQATGSDQVYMLEVDLASLASVRRLADAFRKDFKQLDVLINNAGGYFGYRRTTAEGYEYTFGVNHLSHFLLTNLLKDLLVEGKSRIVNVSSAAQAPGHINFDDLMLEKKFAGFRAYAQAKLANIIFSYELDRRWGKTGITANAVHPGAVGTNFGYDARPAIKFLIKLGKPFLKTPRQGADTVVYLASSPEVEGISGKYFARRKQLKSNAESYDQQVWTRLWEVSEELTGL